MSGVSVSAVTACRAPLTLNSMRLVKVKGSQRCLVLAFRRYVGDLLDHETAGQEDQPTSGFGGRYDYVPIKRRKDYMWPGGKRLAVYFCNNIEYFAFGSGLGSDSTGGPAPQTQRNY